jgi:hypothetical protein
LTSIAHGWASIGMFSQAGLIRSSAQSRLGIFLKGENKFHWSIIMFGVILTINASLPPFPSFFPELIIVIIISSMSLLVFCFILLSISVCYYNVFLFIWLTHLKSFENKSGMVSLINSIRMFFILLVSFNSLIWFCII